MAIVLRAYGGSTVVELQVDDLATQLETQGFVLLEAEGETWRLMRGSALTAVFDHVLEQECERRGWSVMRPGRDDIDEARKAFKKRQKERK